MDGAGTWIRLGWVAQVRVATRQQIVQFRADVLVVIGDDRLHSQLSMYVTAPSELPRVVRKLSKSGGVISRSAAARGAAFSSHMREYFYGVAGDLCPHSTIHDFDSLQAARGAGLVGGLARGAGLVSGLKHVVFGVSWAAAGARAVRGGEGGSNSRKGISSRPSLSRCP